jgi:hypothetical protein
VRLESRSTGGVDPVEHVRNIDQLAFDRETPATARIRASTTLIELAAEERPRVTDARSVHI